MKTRNGDQRRGVSVTCWPIFAQEKRDGDATITFGLECYLTLTATNLRKYPSPPSALSEVVPLPARSDYIRYLSMYRRLREGHRPFPAGENFFLSMAAVLVRVRARRILPPFRPAHHSVQ